MSESGKDSPEVIEFMTLFARLKNWCDDVPEELFDFAKSDSSVKNLCKQLAQAVHVLKRNERRRQVLFATPVDPAFLKAWRDFEERYETVVKDIWFLDFLPDFLADEPSQAPSADLQWENADLHARVAANGIEQAIDFAQFNADQDDRWDASQEDYIELIQNGIAEWNRLNQDAGFDLRGVFRRRALVPFVLVPRRVAAKYGGSEKLSMLNNLQQAHDAFVYGTSYAALALMRSIMEALLRDHYGAEGKDLSEWIQSTRSRLPRGANEAALHRLRKLANAILHLDQVKDEGLPAMDNERLEKEIVSLLFVLRALIEGAPSQRTQRRTEPS